LVGDLRHRRGREAAERGVPQEAFLDSGHLITLGPTVKVESPFVGLERNAHAEFEMGFGGDGNETNVQSMTIKLVHGKDERGSGLIKLHQVDLPAARRPAGG
jgi:hypothetical protein